MISTKALFDKVHEKMQKDEVSCFFISYWGGRKEFVCINDTNHQGSLSLPVESKLKLGEPKLFEDGFIYIFDLPEKVHLNEQNFFVRKISFPTKKMLGNHQDIDRINLERQLINILDYQLPKFRIKA